MPLRKGDSVSLTIGPMIGLSRYTNCKAHATLRRELGDDVEADLADMQVELVRLYRVALLAEIGQLSELQAVVGVPGVDRDDRTIERLADVCAGKAAPTLVKRGGEAPRIRRRTGGG